MNLTFGIISAHLLLGLLFFTLLSTIREQKKIKKDLDREAGARIKLGKELREEMSHMLMTPEERELVGLSPLHEKVSAEIASKIDQVLVHAEPIIDRKLTEIAEQRDRDSGFAISPCGKHDWSAKVLGIPRRESNQEEYGDEEDNGRTYLRRCRRCGAQQCWDSNSYSSRKKKWYDD